MLNKISIFLILIFSFFSDYSFSMQIDIKPEQYEKMSILIGVIKPNKILNQIAQQLKMDLEFEENFDVKIKEFEKINKKQDVLNLEIDGYCLVIFLNFEKEKNTIQWRLYDAIQVNMIKGKKISFDDKNYINIAHNIADQIWSELAGKKSCFSSFIAACKKIKQGKNKFYSYIYLLRPVEILSKTSSPIEIVKEQTICLSPRWNNHKPLLYYSKHTPSNVRLMSLDLNKRKSIVSNFDGLNLTPAFSDDKKIVLSVTVNEKSRLCEYKFDHKTNRGMFVTLTEKYYHAVSPSFINNEEILFCYIDKTNKPRIAIFNINGKHIEFLTKPTEYCSAPAYDKNNNKVAYCKKINGYLQIFLYDLNDKIHKQITFDKTDKDGCSWSPCGTYLTFSCEDKKSSRIAILNIQNNKTQFLTSENEFWTSPSWSPIYDENINFVN